MVQRSWKFWGFSLFSNVVYYIRKRKSYKHGFVFSYTKPVGLLLPVGPQVPLHPQSVVFNLSLLFIKVVIFRQKASNSSLLLTHQKWDIQVQMSMKFQTHLLVWFSDSMLQKLAPCGDVTHLIHLHSFNDRLRILGMMWLYWQQHVFVVDSIPAMINMSAEE